jgi:exopolysaccharide biosynthesis polyprenyl glycosylphosphotransferase
MDTLERAEVTQQTAPQRAGVAQRAAPQRVTVAAQPVAPDDGPARRRTATLGRCLLVADVATVTLGLLATSLARPSGALATGHVALALFALPVWCLALAPARTADRRAAHECRKIVQAAFVTVAVLLGVAVAVDYQHLSRAWVATMAVVVPALVVIGRLLARRWLASRPDHGRRVIVVGTDPEAIALVHAAQRRPELGLTPVGFIGPDDLGSRGGCGWLGDLDQFTTALHHTGADGAVISLASVPPDVVNGLVRMLSDAGRSCSLAPGLRDIDARRCRPIDVEGRTVIDVLGTHHGGWRGALKRLFDVSVAAVALLLSLPLTLAVAVAIKATSPGPVIFAQERVGRDGRRFRIYKFRTMVADAEARKASLAGQNDADGPMFKITRDPRVTRVGAILRKLSIDEIPQFLNVLRGHMSIVGPRPALASEVAQWTDDVHGRLRVLPGITGMWQVSGRSNTSFDEYKRLDLYYVDNWTLAQDLRIVARTIPAVLAKRGAC